MLLHYYRTINLATVPAEELCFRISRFLLIF